MNNNTDYYQTCGGSGYGCPNCEGGLVEAEQPKWGGNEDGFGYCERCGDWTAVVEIEGHDFCALCTKIVRKELS